MKQIRINTDVLASVSISYYQLAKQTGLSVNTIKSIAQGHQRRIDFDVIEKIASCLQINPMELFYETDDEDDNDSDK